MGLVPNGLVAATWAFKREVLRHHLAMGESVTATARRLGIEPTYLIRLKRELGIEGPRGPGRAARNLRGQP